MGEPRVDARLPVVLVLCHALLPVQISSRIVGHRLTATDRAVSRHGSAAVTAGREQAATRRARMDARVKPSDMPPLARLRGAGGRALPAPAPPGGAQEPLWAPAMTCWLVAALVVALLAGLADEAAIRAAIGSHAPAVRFMA